MSGTGEYIAIMSLLSRRQHLGCLALGMSWFILSRMFLESLLCLSCYNAVITEQNTLKRAFYVNVIQIVKGISKTDRYNPTAHTDQSLSI